jgi:uncharacterized protein involved in cysteine biosynthesis
VPCPYNDMRFIFAGTALILRTPRLWRFIVQPLLSGALAFLLVSAGAYWLIVPGLNARIDHLLHATGYLSGVVAVLTTGLYLGLLILTSGFLYLTLAALFSASLWSRLSLEVELSTTGRRVETKLPVSAIVGDSVARGLFAIAVTLLSLCCGWTFFGLPAILMAGFLGLHDYTSAAYLRRGVTFPAQMSHVRGLPARFGFLLGGGLLTLIPVVNVIMLPCLVAGGTLMVVAGERD